MVTALAAHARGAVDLAAGNAGDALPHLRHALALWQELGVRYEQARVRRLIAQACRALGDEDSSRMDFDAALETLDTLGVPMEHSDREATHGLTERELHVLRLLAAGSTNKAIAAQLILSDRTVDRHVSNIFAKMGVSSRAAATAYAYEHRLL